MWHRSGAGGIQICQARAALLDVLLRYLWEAARGTLSEQARKEFPAIALVAIGGYGRAELNPHSDIDFMFLHNRQIAGGTRALASIQNPEWVALPALGHWFEDRPFGPQPRRLGQSPQQ